MHAALSLYVSLTHTPAGMLGIALRDIHRVLLEEIPGRKKNENEIISGISKSRMIV
jgi:hypothetical protein